MADTKQTLAAAAALPQAEGRKGMFKKYRSTIVFILFIGGIINYLDRSALSVAAPLIAEEFELNPAQLGMVFSIFSVGYAAFCFIGGYLSDKLGPYKVLFCAVLFWSLACGATALTMGFVSLMVVRFLFGIGEGPLGSSINKTVNNWIPKKERTSAVALSNCGQPLGGAISAPIVGFVALYFGWRFSFVVIMIVGLIWVAFWKLKARDYPRQHPSVSQEEIAEIEADQDKLVTNKAEKKPLSYYIRQRSVVIVAFGLFAYNYILFFFLTWFPSYLTMAKHLSIKDMSIVTVLPWIIGCIGQVVGGTIGDYLYKRTGNGILARKIMIVGNMIIAAVMVVLAGVVETAMSAVIVMSVGIWFFYLAGASYWAIMQDIAPRENVGGVSGFIHGIANVAGVVSPAVTGFIVHATGVFTGAFALAGGIAIVAAIMVGILVKPAKPAEKEIAAE